jgi:hypothetical protein
MLETYNPILAKEELKGLGKLLQRPPIPEPGLALVFSGNGIPLLTITQGQKTVTWGEARWNYNLVYKVDLTEHPLSFQCDVPCKGDAYKFHAEATFRCTVRDPEMIVDRNITDVAQWLKTSVEDQMRLVSRKFDIKQSGEAEIEMRKVVGQAIYEVGFDLNNFTLKLTLGEEAVDWIQTQTRIQEQINLERTKQDLERQKSQFDIERDQAQTEFSRKKQEEELAFQNKLTQQQLQAKLQQQHLEQMLIQQQAEFELKIMQQKTEFYGSMLQQGNLQLLALQLAQNPGDVQAILQALNEQKQLDRENNIRVLETLLNADAVEGWQLTEVGKHALKELLGVAAQPTPVLQGNENDGEKSQDISSTVDAEISNSSNFPQSEPTEPDWDVEEEE